MYISKYIVRIESKKIHINAQLKYGRAKLNFEQSNIIENFIHINRIHTNILLYLLILCYNL